MPGFLIATTEATTAQVTKAGLLFVFDRVYPVAGGLKKGEIRRIEIKEIDSGEVIGPRAGASLAEFAINPGPE